jgi:hypothetical protein
MSDPNCKAIESMWVRAPQTVVWGDRHAVATITRSDFVNAGFLLRQFPMLALLDEFNEVFVRGLLKDKYGERVSSWCILNFGYSIKRQEYDILVSAPEFDSVGIGETAPYVKEEDVS